jgi:hypothetical protein
MKTPSRSRARRRSELALAATALLAWTGCGDKSLTDVRPDGSVPATDGSRGEAGDGRDAAVQSNRNEYDLLFLIDDSSSMAVVQQKLLAQLPTFMQVLQALPGGLPSVHIAVVSSDMGAPSDTSIGCSAAGDQGVFFSRPQGTCTATTLTAGSTFITDDVTGNSKNFTAPDPAGLPSVFQCIGLLGTAGCGFGHQLASIDRALGADGLGPSPLMDQGFLREGAYLGIVIVSNQDDCSAPAGSPRYSLNGGSSDLGNPLGPLTHYRCNLAGHLCQDLNSGSTDMTKFASPPLNPPSWHDGTADAPTLTLSNCESNDDSSSGLTPVSKFITDIKALKPDPANQILVSAITGVNGTDPSTLTSTPYTIAWLPGAGSASNELWPQIAHACGPAGPGTAPGGHITTDGSFADPAVRIAQFVRAFGSNGVLTSACDDNYASAMAAIAARI